MYYLIYGITINIFLKTHIFFRVGKTPIESALASGFKELANKIAFWAAIEWKANVIIYVYIQYIISKIIHTFFPFHYRNFCAWCNRKTLF